MIELKEEMKKGKREVNKTSKDRQTRKERKH
jgi:hypothetical protein